MQLIAPDSYRRASPEEIAARTNGCGPQGWRGDIVIGLNSLAGLDISGPCRIHDWMYFVGGDEAARKEADITLYLNISILVLEAGGPLKSVRMAGAATFYLAVRAGGAEHFGGAQ